MSRDSDKHSLPARSNSRPPARAHTIHVRGAREHNLKNVDLEFSPECRIVE